ncbi:MAG: hypothetical protein ACKO3K_10660 [Cuspidothrix sp.]
MKSDTITINNSTSKVQQLSINKPQPKKHQLSMIWVEDANGKLIAEWTLQD